VIVGCHYDSWTFGAVNPNSGTAVLMELSKAFSALQSKGAVHNIIACLVTAMLLLLCLKVYNVVIPFHQSNIGDLTWC